jgi:hypothetical protein
MTYKLAAEILKTTYGSSIYDEAIRLAVTVLEEKAQKELSCSNCDRFGQDCGSCEVDEDD